MTQRRFEVEAEAPPPTAEAEPVASPAPESPAPPTPQPPRPPSGDSLRERQLRWLAERARFESRGTTRPPRPVPPTEGTK